jgi:hypothetical protein
MESLYKTARNLRVLTSSGYAKKSTAHILLGTQKSPVRTGVPPGTPSGKGAAASGGD